MAEEEEEEAFDYFQDLPDIPQSLLNDLCSRFLINIPSNEKNDMVRFCFQIELAHWYYIDFCRQDNPDLPPCGMKAFISRILTDYKFLNKSHDSIQSIYEKWKLYKHRVPVFGAILLEESLENCLLVQGFHKKTSWSFPKGKVNDGEGDLECAVREVREEVGYNIARLANPNQYLENNFHDHQVRLYIIPGVDPRFKFKSKTRDEIREIRWFPVDFLPTTKKDKTPQKEFGLLSSNFFMIHSFIKPLQKWIAEKKNNMSPVKINQLINQPCVDHKKSKEFSDRKELQKRQRKEKEDEDFKQKHLLINNSLTAGKDDENMLKSMLGLSCGSVSKPPGAEATQKSISDTISLTDNIDNRKKMNKKKCQELGSSPHGIQIGRSAPVTPTTTSSTKKEINNNNNNNGKNNNNNGKNNNNNNNNGKNKNLKLQNQDANHVKSSKKKCPNSSSSKCQVNSFFSPQSKDGESTASSTHSHSLEYNSKFDFCSSAFVDFHLDHNEILSALCSVTTT